MGLEQNKTKTRKYTEDRSGLHVVKTTVNFRLFFFWKNGVDSFLRPRSNRGGCKKQKRKRAKGTPRLVHQETIYIADVLASYMFIGFCENVSIKAVITKSN